MQRCHLSQVNDWVLSALAISNLCHLVLVAAQSHDIIGPIWSGELAGVEVLRVLTRFVQKCTLRARLEPTGPHEAVEGRTGDAGELGDGGFGNAQIEEAPDVVLLAVEP